uniref:Amphiregulin n=2 Tax=Salarias fasciatus TaxID=181472 RepID=A0A672H5I9_SALFA
ATYSSALAGAPGGPASEEGLPSSASDDDELEISEELSGGQNFSAQEFRPLNDDKKKRKSKGKRKNKHKSKSTTPLNPGHTSIDSRYTSSASSTTQNPCTSTHLSYCIHGYCKYIEGVHEPVCICMTGYEGTRCGIQTLGSGTPPESRNRTELVQTVLVIIAVILSVISCIAILLMTCAHYRSHKNFLATYLGSGSEQEKLQKPVQDAVV